MVCKANLHTKISYEFVEQIFKQIVVTYNQAVVTVIIEH